MPGKTVYILTEKRDIIQYFEENEKDPEVYIHFSCSYLQHRR